MRLKTMTDKQLEKAHSLDVLIIDHVSHKRRKSNILVYMRRFMEADTLIRNMVFQSIVHPRTKKASSPEHLAKVYGYPSALDRFKARKAESMRKRCEEKINKLMDM